MTNHPHRNWRRRWTVDLAARTATHESGVVVRFAPRDDGGWDGTAENLTVSAESLADPHLASRLARLMREAGDAFVEAMETSP